MYVNFLHRVHLAHLSHISFFGVRCIIPGYDAEFLNTMYNIEMTNSSIIIGFVGVAIM